MELIVINENKLKIIMNAHEMRAYGLDENEFHLCISDTRRILSKILHNSPVKTGFESTSPEEKILLQLYPERRGGCELYVTRLSLESEYGLQEDALMETEDNRLLPVQKVHIKEKKPLLCYSFGELSDLIHSCRALALTPCEKESSAHLGDDGKYYLILSHGEKSAVPCRCSAILSEFGELVNAEQVVLNMCEHGRQLCETDAIGRFAKL